MKKVFADTNYWVAITNPRDNLHALALEARKKAGSVVIVTTDEVMVEYLNFFSKQSEQIRAATLKSIKTIRSNPNIVVAPQTRDSFDMGMKLFEERKDKQYSLTDCISMKVMWREGITDVLTNDHHFAQEVTFPTSGGRGERVD